jgi:hypothetical protein
LIPVPVNEELPPLDAGVVPPVGAPLPPAPTVIEKTSAAALKVLNSTYPPPPPPPPIAEPPPPPPATIRPLNEVNPAGVFHVHVPTLLNVTTV